jgi:hypothetical protein
MVRKTVLDFCYVPIKGGSKSLSEWLKKKKLKQEWVGLSAIDHMHDTYAMWYDEKENGKPVSFGIVSDENKANDVQIMSIPKTALFLDYLYFNKDGYSTHCRRFKEYQEWLSHRNENRFKMNKEHGKNYDSKNMMHTYRLLSMAHEMAQGELRVRRTPEEIVKLMKIRRGEYEYEDLLKEAEAMAVSLDQVFKESKILDKVDVQAAYDTLLNLRQFYYFHLEPENI